MNPSKPSEDFVSLGLPSPMRTPVLVPSTSSDDAQVPSSAGSEATDEDAFSLSSKSLL